MTWEARVRLRLGSLHLDVELSGDQTPVAVIGPNGSGKTTFLRTIAGAYRLEAGYIRVGDHVLARSDEAGEPVDVPPEERSVGYVPQGFGLFPHLSAVDNVAFGQTAGPRKSPRRLRRKAATALLERMECLHLVARMPSQLSGGEQQKIALARALMIDPAILLLDEPLSALDAPSRRVLRSYLARHLSDRGRPALLVTHDVRDVLALGAYVCAMEGGRVVQTGTPAELAGDPATPFVAEFFDLGTIEAPRPPQDALDTPDTPEGIEERS